MKIAVFLIFVAMISIQFGAGFAKSLFPEVGSAGTSTLRLLFATLILWIIWRPWRFRFETSSIKNLVFYGGSLGLMNLTFYFALDRIPLGLAVTLEFVGPLTLSVLTSRRKPDFIWIILAAIGIYLVMPQSTTENTTDVVGVLCALVAGAFWALYIYFGQRAGSAIPGGIAATAGMTIAALVVTPFGIFVDGSRLLNVSILPLALLVASLSSALPYSLEMISLKRMPAKTFSLLMSLEPVIASLVGLLLLNEHLTLVQWLAITLIITASIGSVAGASKK